MRLRWRFRQKNGPGRLPLLILAWSAPSPLWGEGWGEGNMRLRWWFRSPYVLHFSVRRVTRERARGARRLPPGYPGSRQRKSPLRGALSLFLQAFGSGTSLHPCRLCPLGASLRLAPALRKRFVDFQPDSGVAISRLKYCDYFIALRAIKILGIPQPIGRGRKPPPGTFPLHRSWRLPEPTQLG
ncbi:hypothetical protein M2354_000287 [Leclercia adecarboxylata]|nr:hypothetical protein [Leclercia adecarboxylata]